MDRPHVEALVESTRVNAALSWLVVGLLIVAVVAAVVGEQLLWGGFAVVVTVLVLLPPVVRRDPESMLPWEVVLLAGLPVLGRVLATVPVTGRIATYLSVAAVALVVAVELHLYTPVRMNVTFAIVFVVVATMAAAGFWAVTRWLADVYLGTAFFHDPALSEVETERALMLEFVASTIAGVVAGIVFEFYVRRRARPAARIPGGDEREAP